MSGGCRRHAPLVLCACVSFLLFGCMSPRLQPASGAVSFDAATVDGVTVDGATVDGATVDGATVDGAVSESLAGGRVGNTRSAVSTWVRTGLDKAAQAPGSGRIKLPFAKAAATHKHLLVLPLEYEGDNGAPNGVANLLRLQPAYEWPVRFNWKIQHLDIITLANAPGGIAGSPGNPAPLPGNRATGLGDLVHASFVSPGRQGEFTWGAGAALGLPTATEDVLGSGKWSAGPALRARFSKGHWSIGAMGMQRWSFAGASDRAETNQLMLRPTLLRQLGSRWYFISSPILTANWKASSSERWLVPVGGGIGRKFRFAGLNWSASLQAYVNVIKPTGAPEWAIRTGLTAIVPLH